MDTVSGGAMTNPEEDLAEGSVAVRVLVQAPAVTAAADIRNKRRLVFGLSVSIVNLQFLIEGARLRSLSGEL